MHLSMMPHSCAAAVLLIKAIERWRAEHSGNLPATSKDKAAFRQLLQSWQRRIEDVPIEVSCDLTTRLGGVSLCNALVVSSPHHRLQGSGLGCRTACQACCRNAGCMHLSAASAWQRDLYLRMRLWIIMATLQ